MERVIPIAVLAIGLLLALVLRSLVAPLYLIVSLVLSYLAALGLSILVVIDLAGQDGLIFLLPFLMFLFLLALGEDYNILVMSRIREEARHRPLGEAVIEAIGQTGSTVTSAGIILASTFAVFAMAGGNMMGGQLRGMGFGLAVGILLDTFLVRTLLVPSTVVLLGKRNWWPSAIAPLDNATPTVEPTRLSTTGLIRTNSGPYAKDGTNVTTGTGDRLPSKDHVQEFDPNFGLVRRSSGCSSAPSAHDWTR